MRQRLHDFHALLRAHRQVAHEVPGVKHESRLGADRPNAPRDDARVEAPASAQGDVFGHGQRGNQHEVLVHHANAGRRRIGCTTESSRASAHGDRAGVCLDQTEGDAHQRGLAGTVFAQQRVHGSGAHVQCRARERLHCAEPLADVAQRERRHPRGHSPVGALTNVQGSPKTCSRFAARAQTPSVSVA